MGNIYAERRAAREAAQVAPAPVLPASTTPAQAFSEKVGVTPPNVYRQRREERGEFAVPITPKEDPLGQFGAGLVTGIPNAVIDAGGMAEVGRRMGIAMPGIDMLGGMAASMIKPMLPTDMQSRIPDPTIPTAVREGLSAAHLNPENYFRPPATAIERISRLGGEGAITSVFSPNKASGWGKLVQAAKEMGIGATAGAGAQAGMEVAPDWADPLVGLAAGMGTGVAAAGAFEVPGMMARGVRDTARYVAPAVAGRRSIEKMAGEQIAGVVGDRDAAISALGAADEIVPGSRPTSFQATGNVRLGTLQRALERGDDEFKRKLLERLEQQNEARLTALDTIQESGNPALVADFFRGRMRELEATADELYDVAETKAKGAYEGLGERPAGEIGDQARAAIERQFKALNAEANKLWDSIDPDGNLVVATKPLVNSAARIYGTMSPEEALSLAAREKSIAGIIGGYTDTLPFRRFKDLRSEISAAMREAKLGGNDKAYGRLSRLRTAIEEAVSDSIAGKMEANPSLADDFVRKSREWHEDRVGSAAGDVPAARPVAAAARTARGVPEGSGAGSPQGGVAAASPRDTGLPEDGGFDRVAAARQAQEISDRINAASDRNLTGARGERPSADEIALRDALVQASSRSPSVGPVTKEAVLWARDNGRPDIANEIVRKITVARDGAPAGSPSRKVYDDFLASIERTPEDAAARRAVEGGGRYEQDGNFIPAGEEFHGTRTRGLSELRSSERGAFGPGVYMGREDIGRRYAGAEGEVLPVEYRGKLFSLMPEWVYEHNKPQINQRIMSVVNHLPDGPGKQEFRDWWKGGTGRNVADVYDRLTRGRNAFTKEQVSDAIRRAGYSGIEGIADGREVVVFNPGDTRIKGQRPSTAGQLFQSGIVSNPDAEFPRPFYSAALKSVEESKTNRASPQQWAATIKNTPGVKQEELDWLGLPGWLAQQKGAITKEQVADFIRANQIEVEEVDLSGTSAEAFEADLPRRFDWEPDEVDEDFVREIAAERAAEEADDYRERVANSEGIEPEEVTDAQIEELAFDDEMRWRAQEPDGYHTSVTVETPDGSQTIYEINRDNSGYTQIYNVNDMGEVASGQLDDADIRSAIARHLEENFEKPGDEGADGPSQYEEYTLPGGKDYHELLLKLPKREAADMTRPSEAVVEKYSAEWDAITAKMNDERVRTQAATTTEDYRAGIARQNALIDEQDALHAKMVEETRATAAPWRSGENFEAPHYDDQSQNVLAHVRFKDRTSVDGKRTLFLEEVQSDWHQQGRDKGYKSDQGNMEEELARLKAAADKAEDALHDAVAAVPGAERIPALRQERNDAGVRNDMARWQAATDEIDRIQNAQDAIKDGPIGAASRGAYLVYANFQRSMDQAVPDAPFKTTWPELALKRMIRWAADNGYDQIAWTPGSVQNARYGLSRHVDQIDWEASRATGNKRIWFSMPGRGSTGVSVDAEGKIIRSDMGQNVVGKPLSELIGKDLASQVMADAEGRISKEGLTEIGGSGMREFYDRVLVSLGNKLGKKFGTQVGKTEIAIPRTGTSIGIAGGQNLEAAALPITDEMRAGVQRGQPLFQKAHEAATSPHNGLPEPTAAQKEAGNYKKGHFRLGGLDLSIENPVGSKRSGTDASGKPWSVDMKDHYGYIRGTVGRDKDHIDTFVAANAPALNSDSPVFVVNQIDPKTGKFDEHKVMLGYPNRAAAEAAYKANYAKGWKGMGSVSETTLGDLKKWIADGNTKSPFKAQPKSIADTMAQRFAGAGRPEREAQAAGQLVDAFYTTLAGRAGKSVDDIQAIAPLPRVEKGGTAAGLKQVPIDEAKRLNTPVKMPKDETFTTAVGNTPGAKITDDGLVMDLTRYQPPEQGGGQAIRTGMFYLPSSSKNLRYYRTPPGGRPGTWYGGNEKVQGATLIRNPLFVKGATGGAAPEAAYAQLKGKRALEDLKRSASSAASDGWMNKQEPGLFEHRIEKFLEEHGADPGMAYEIIRVSRKGNTLRYALQENIIAHAIREAGHDAMLGWSKGKSGPFISEVFDVREEMVPTSFGDYSVRDEFYQGPRGSILLGRDGAPSLISLFEKADASTALHESAHQFLDMFQRVATDAGAPDALKRDWSATRAWWEKNAAELAKDAGEGVTAQDVRRALRGDALGGAKDAALTRGMHEQWARAFEVYLREGKAPNAAMKGLFDQFKDWLTQVYRSITGMGVNLSPEIRGVFDRMLGGEANLIDEAAAGRFKAATAATRNIKDTFGAKPVKGIMRRPGPTYPYEMSPEGVSSQLFKPGPEGAANIQNVMKAGAPKDAIEAAAVLSAKRSAGKEGALDPAKFEAWRSKHADALKALPELDRKMGTAAAATRTMIETGERNAKAIDSVRKSAIGKLLNVEADADVVTTIGNMLGRADAVKSMRELAAQAASDPNALEGLRRAVIDHMLSRLKTPKDALRADTFQRFVGKNAPAVAQVLTPEQMAGLRAIAQDLKRATKDIRASGGGSDTAENLMAIGKYLHDKPSILQTLIRQMLASTATHMAAHFVAPGVGSFASWVGQTLGQTVFGQLRANGIAKVDQLIKEAILDPDLMRTLLLKAPKAKNRGSALTLSQRLANIAAMNLALGVGQAQDRNGPRVVRRRADDSAIMPMIGTRG